MPKKETATPLSLRLDPKVVARIDRVIKGYVKAFEDQDGPAFLRSRNTFSRADVLRTAITTGLDLIEANLKEKTSKGKTAGKERG